MLKKEIIKEIISQFHAESARDVRSRDIKLAVNSGKIVTVSGVRRSGKTFMLYETIERLIQKDINIKHLVYINFEDERLELHLQELDLILQAYLELYPDIELSKCYFFFDEIQNINDWDKFIRRLYDKTTKNIFITGSNSRLLSREIATSLRGRTITYEVYPLSFHEYLAFHNVEINIYKPATKAKIFSMFEKYLFEGGFPELIFLDKRLKNRVLQEYLDVMLFRDLIERYNIANISVLKYFMKRIFSNLTKPLSVNKIYNELKSQGYKIGKNLLYDLLDAMVSSYLCMPLVKYANSIIRQELSEKKVYIVDNGLVGAVNFGLSRDYGKLLENTVFLHLFRRYKKIFFYKEKSECDYVFLDEKDRFHAVQVSYSLSDAETKSREIEGIVAACKRLGIKRGKIITMAEEKDFTSEGIDVEILPAFKFLVL